MPKTPELNGLAERKNRTIMERVRSMLAHAKLPNTFWAEALSTTMYVINRSPSVPLDGDVPRRRSTRTIIPMLYSSCPRKKEKEEIYIDIIMDAQMGSALPSEKLDGNNFASWEYKMHQYLVGHVINPAQRLSNTQHGSNPQAV